MRVRQIIIMFCLVVGLSGCSLLPRITFDRAGVTPTSTEKSSKRETCAGSYKVDSEGNIIECTKGYYKNENNYKQAERKFTLQERVANFIRSLAGWGFPLLIIACIFIPGFGGWLLNRFTDGTKLVAKAGLKLTSRALKEWKEELPDDLSAETKKVIDDLFDKLEDAHSTDPAVIKMIGDIRTQLKIEDNDK